MKKHIWSSLVLLCLSIFIVSSLAMADNDDFLNDPARRYVKAFYPNLDIARKTIKTFVPAPPEVNYDEGYVVMFVTDEDIIRFSAENWTFEDFPAYDLHHNRSLEDEDDALPGYPCYPTVEETFSFAQKLSRDYPNLAQWKDYGDSWKKTANQGGYDMMVLKLTNSAVTGPKPKLFITAAIHAREYSTSPLAYHFAKQLVENFQIDPDIRWIMDYHEIHLMLHANPDGRKKAEGGAYWRKNTNKDYCGANSSDRGADLNRNFDFKWGKVPGGSSGRECDEDYRGPWPASEPEVEAIQDYMKRIFQDYNGNNPNNGAPEDASGIYIDIHSYSELVLYPWGWTSQSAPNRGALRTLARKFAFFNDYAPQPAYNLYPTDGTTDDYAYAELGVAAYTFELGTSFFQGCNSFNNKILPDNLKALFYAAKVARAPYMLPSGPDALSVSVDGLTLTAAIDDTRFKKNEPTQKIVAAEYYIDTPPWERGANAIAMSASDGGFNEKKESVTAKLNLTDLGDDQHIIFVRGQDASGNWGPMSAVFYSGSGSGDPVFDGFESKNFSGGTGWLGPWSKQGKLVLVKNNPYEGRRYAKLMGGRSPGLLERSVDLSAASSARLKFAARVKSFENKDKAFVKVSPDGVNYTVVMEFTSDYSNNQWEIYDIDLSGFELTRDFRIVFEAAMGRKRTDLWFLDNIEVY